MIVGNRAKRSSFSKFDLASASEQTQDRDSGRRKDQHDHLYKTAQPGIYVIKQHTSTRLLSLFRAGHKLFSAHRTLDTLKVDPPHFGRRDYLRALRTAGDAACPTALALG